MLYDAHKFSQLEDALELHHRHSQRWGGAFEMLGRDFTSSKLYSRHYYLMLFTLRELSKLPEERQDWLL
jgi:hypothetical protein